MGSKPLDGEWAPSPRAKLFFPGEVSKGVWGVTSGVEIAVVAPEIVLVASTGLIEPSSTPVRRA